jgi:hypothetical protein
MKAKKLWLLLPVASMWVLWAIGYNFLGSGQFYDKWYSFPLLVTLVFAWLASLVIAERMCLKK